MALTYPTVNGVRHSWPSVAVFIGNAQFMGCKSLNYDDGVDPATLHGNTQNIIATTAGQYSATGDIEFYLEEALQIIAALGTPWTGPQLIVQVQYKEDNLPIRTHKLPVRLTKLSEGGSEGAEGLTGKFTMTFVDSVDRDGVKAVRPINASIVVSNASLTAQ